MKKLLSEQQDPYRLNRGLVKSTLRFAMDENAHVPDTLTRIRVLEGVAVVGQGERVERKKRGRTFLDVYIKFLPESSEVVKDLVEISKKIKKLPGIQLIKILTIDGREVMVKGKPILV
tara:strand:- start:1429 stop:1782 length:354 start_codon:yes stop_codon:yes gene_type:complete